MEWYVDTVIKCIIAHATTNRMILFCLIAANGCGMLYQIKAASKEDNPVLDYNIVVTEQRLTALGYCDLNKLKP